MSWLGAAPSDKKDVALLIPQYNESANNSNFRLRLRYFHQIAQQFRNIIDVVLIDDGSTDDSLEQIKLFVDEQPDSFFVSVVKPNYNKVGALYKTVLAIQHEFVILSDFDTDIQGLDLLYNQLGILRADQNLMGCYFRMLPFEGNGSVFQFQQLEYSMARACYKFHKSEQSVPVMPGAGCCYKRKALKDIYDMHSGLRSGEDREATLLGLKLGYKTLYIDNILTLTRPPLSFKSLIRQRIRWNLGYIETFFKERDYYMVQIRKFTKIGIRTIVDIVRVNLVVFLPLIILVGVVADWRFVVLYLLITYIASIFISVNAVLIAPEESIEFKEKRIHAILYYPLFKISLDCLAWTFAFFSFVKKRK
jgi:cellulose synthase/poly-beta-1,6-N-acetylglucosamine synthase-like glycosyltransferase